MLSIRGLSRIRYFVLRSQTYSPSKRNCATKCHLAKRRINNCVTWSTMSPTKTQ